MVLASMCLKELVQDRHQHVHAAVVAPHREAVVVVAVKDREHHADQRGLGVALQELAIGVADQEVHRLGEQQRAHVPQVTLGIRLAALAEGRGIEQRLHLDLPLFVAIGGQRRGSARHPVPAGRLSSQASGPGSPYRANVCRADARGCRPWHRPVRRVPFPAAPGSACRSGARFPSKTCRSRPRRWVRSGHHFLTVFGDEFGAFFAAVFLQHDGGLGV
jgi:hypothetical protein